MKSYQSILELRFVVFWVLVTAAGGFLAMLTAPILLAAVEGVAGVLADEVFVGSILGLFLGFGQWLILRERLSGSGWWVILSLAGGMIFGFVANRAGNRVGSVAVFTTFGIILGLCQWYVLRRGGVWRSGVWIPASGAAWAVSPQVISWIDAVALDSTWPFGELTTVAIMYGLIGGLTGAITGVVLAWMIKNTDLASHLSGSQAAA